MSVPETETLPSITNSQTVQNKTGNRSNIVVDPVAPTESLNIASL